MPNTPHDRAPIGTSQDVIAVDLLATEFIIEELLVEEKRQ